MIDGRTKADFRARREMVGLSQADVAEALAVAVNTVKRWEKPGEPEPPEDAWSLVEFYEASQDAAVSEAVMRFPEGASATLTIWRTQADYDAHGPDLGPFGVANANALEAARELDSMGVRVSFRYSSGGDADDQGDPA